MDNEGRTEAEPFSMWIERGKVREFAAATHSRSGAYEHDDAVIPPTFLMTQTFWQKPENRAPLPIGGHVLHGEQEFLYHGTPPAVGDHLTAQCKITDVYEKEGRRGGSLKFTTMTTEFRDDQGELRAESKMTLVETTKPAGVK